MDPGSPQIREHRPRPDDAPYLRAVGYCALALAAVATIETLPLFPVMDGSRGARLFWLSACLGSAIVLAGYGGRLYQKAWRQLCTRVPGFALLFALATLATLVHGVVAAAAPTLLPPVFRHSYLAFPLLTLTLVCTGRLLEARTHGPSRRGIRSLRALRPLRALRLAEGSAETVSLRAIRKGDCLRVAAGERVPVDGVIESGTAVIDQSLLTGDATPVSRGPGDEVVGATLNRGGEFVLRATRTSRQNVLTRLIDDVRRARRHRPLTPEAVDRVAAVLLPVVAAIAAVAGLGWLLLTDAGGAHVLAVVLGVLLVACPPALPLAAPLALAVGMTRGAENGAMVRRGQALRAAGAVTLVVLRKTGTVTRGEPDVNAVEPMEGVGSRELFRWAASLATGSEHPGAAAIVAAAAERDVTLSSVTERAYLAGSGLLGRIAGREVILGSAACLARLGVANPLAERGEELQDEAGTPLFVAVESRVVGLIALADPPRPDAAAAVARLRGMGLRVVMLSGGDERTARAVAREVGIDEVIAGVAPGDKVRCIRALQARGERVAMVGRNIRDAAALTQADLAFAPADGFEAARQNADVVLTGSELHGVADTLALGRATMRNVRQNLAAAILYNGVAMPVAAGLFYPSFGWLLDPGTVAVAALLSIITIVANANRLRFAEVDGR